MALPPYLKTQNDLVLVHVKAQPRASQNAIGEVIGNELKIKITAPPVDSAANQALVELLADILGCSKNSVQLLRGGTSRHKVFAIRGIPAAKVAERLHVNGV